MAELGVPGRRLNCYINSNTDGKAQCSSSAFRVCHGNGTLSREWNTDGRARCSRSAFRVCHGNGTPGFCHGSETLMADDRPQSQFHTHTMKVFLSYSVMYELSFFQWYFTLFASVYLRFTTFAINQTSMDDNHK